MVTWHMWPMAPNSTALRSWALKDLVPAGKITFPAPSMKMDLSKWSIRSPSPKISWKCELRPLWHPGQVLSRRGRMYLVPWGPQNTSGLAEHRSPQNKTSLTFLLVWLPFLFFPGGFPPYINTSIIFLIKIKSIFILTTRSNTVTLSEGWIHSTTVWGNAVSCTVFLVKLGNVYLYIFFLLSIQCFHILVWSW